MDDSKQQVTIYTDGGCDPNPGPGGWAAVIQVTAPESPAEIVLTGNAPQATNNRMELEAAIAALAFLGGRYGRCQVQLHTDSTYVQAGISSWIERWVANGMMMGMPVINQRGLVGRITEVYQSASRVLLITDSDSSVNSVLQNARLRGVVRGRTLEDPIMDYLPPEQPVNVGDIILTSGEGGNFPNGIPVGQVVEVQRNDVEMFQRAIVRTTVDFNTLETVLVITNFDPIPVGE